MRKDTDKQPLQHYNQQVKRRSEFIMPPNTLREKVGRGGLHPDTIKQAEELTQDSETDFSVIVEQDLKDLMNILDGFSAKDGKQKKEERIRALFPPIIHLRSHGTMFSYPIVTTLANDLIRFLEVIENLDNQALKIVLAFHGTIRMVAQLGIKEAIDPKGEKLLSELTKACHRYFEKRKA